MIPPILQTNSDVLQELVKLEFEDQVGKAHDTKCVVIALDS